MHLERNRHVLQNHGWGSLCLHLLETIFMPHVVMSRGRASAVGQSVFIKGQANAAPLAVANMATHLLRIS